jgi:hypothetical protein
LTIDITPTILSSAIERRLAMKFPGFSPASAIAGFSKVIIYLAFGIGLIWFLYSIGSFIYLMGNAEDLSHVTVTNMLELPVSEHGGASTEATAANGMVHFRLHKQYAEYSYLQMPRRLILCLFLGSFAMIFLYFVVFVSLANLIENLTDGKQFVKENAVFARRIGLAMIGYGLIKIAWKATTIALFRDYIEIPGARMPLSLYFTTYFRPEIILAGFVVLVIAGAFKQAADMREEQELTV